MQTILKAFVFFTFGIVFFSCQKSSNSDSGSGYVFKGNYEGVEKSFNISLLASKSSLDSATYYLTIVGASDSEASAIVLWSDQDNFTAGSTYSMSALNGRENNYLSYCSQQGSSAPDSNWNTTYNFSHVSQSFNCTITEITSAYVKGTFSGVLYMSTDSAIVTKTIEGGQFYAKFF